MWIGFLQNGHGCLWPCHCLKGFYLHVSFLLAWRYLTCSTPFWGPHGWGPNLATWQRTSPRGESRHQQHPRWHPNKIQTRWSPRTRMLTRMLMVQMSKHMVMQSRTKPFCNSLFEQSCACFPCYQSAVRSGKCSVWSVECEVRSVECKVWSGECRVCKE